MERIFFILIIEEKLFKTNIDCFIYYPLDGYLYKYFGLPKQPEKITWDLLLKIK